MYSNKMEKDNAIQFMKAMFLCTLAAYPLVRFVFKYNVFNAITGLVKPILTMRAVCHVLPIFWHETVAVQSYGFLFWSTSFCCC